MKISATQADESAVIAATGELDAETAPLLRDAVDTALDAGVRWILFDLQGLDFIGSVGIGELIRAAKFLNERGGDLAVACRRPNVRRVFEISGTSELLHMRAEEAEARAVLDESRRHFQAACPSEEGEAHGQVD